MRLVATSIVLLAGAIMVSTDASTLPGRQSIFVPIGALIVFIASGLFIVEYVLSHKQSRNATRHGMRDVDQR